MVSLLLLFLISLIGSSMTFRADDLNYFHRHARHNEQQQRVLRNILGKLIDTESNTIYNLDAQKQQGISSNTGASISAGPSTRVFEDLACLEACYKCVEDYPLTTVRSSLSLFFDADLFFRSFSARKKQPIIVDQCAIVRTVALVSQSNR